MVNHQTSQYELLNFIFKMFCLGIFQYVKDILQVLTHHPSPCILICWTIKTKTTFTESTVIKNKEQKNKKGI